MTNVAPFKNQHPQLQRLSRFETCPLSYPPPLHRGPRPSQGCRSGSARPSTPSSARLIRRSSTTSAGPCPGSAYRALPRGVGSGWLTGTDILRRGARHPPALHRRAGVVDHRTSSPSRREFRLPVGPFEVLGFIDRRLARRRDRRGHRLQDQPPALHPRRGRHLFLQMSLYEGEMVPPRPWAKKVKLYAGCCATASGRRRRAPRSSSPMRSPNQETLGADGDHVTEYPARL